MERNSWLRRIWRGLCALAKLYGIWRMTASVLRMLDSV